MPHLATFSAHSFAAASAFSAECFFHYGYRFICAERGALHSLYMAIIIFNTLFDSNPRRPLGKPTSDSIHFSLSCGTVMASKYRLRVWGNNFQRFRRGQGIRRYLRVAESDISVFLHGYIFCCAKLAANSHCVGSYLLFFIEVSQVYMRMGAASEWRQFGQLISTVLRKTQLLLNFLMKNWSQFSKSPRICHSAASQAKQRRRISYDCVHSARTAKEEKNNNNKCKNKRWRAWKQITDCVDRNSLLNACEFTRGNDLKINSRLACHVTGCMPFVHFQCHSAAVEIKWKPQTECQRRHLITIQSERNARERQNQSTSKGCLGKYVLREPGHLTKLLIRYWFPSRT